ncbi:hypothetical protein [Carboxydothermus ferrireducens]|uniref:Uncharacterized protein n=1 Tax=Carboxydothermus ferrireducens DSM 11255 TaxID=1119529 RepID=A0ABX2RFH5_9THEO|nr:hypothetical protein [Carboxydothermus ferrireducens]NYE58615.1 hypothetical protein [Carboxydothermus ferrireducens DSM 11255]
MLSKVHTIALNGINGEIVEVDINRGLPGMKINLTICLSAG